MDHGRHTYLTFRNILIYVVLLWSGMTVNAQSGKGSFAGRVVDKEYSSIEVRFRWSKGSHRQ